MSRISVRGLAVASATAVTTVGAVVGVASGADQGSGTAEQPVEAAGTTTLLADIPAGQQVQQASLTEQVQAQSDAADASARQSAEQAARVQAAKDAAKKKKADDAAAAKAAQIKAESGTGDASATFSIQASYTTAQVQAMAKEIVGSGQYMCFSNIVTRESGWNYTATNASSGAYGLVQALPGSKMASAGADWQTNPATQIKWGLNYMNSRYGSPCDAWQFWQVNHYY
ncbi:Transglycosylase SLT domain-containing protein [Actinacidiphila yanglinensis]|uniref:Transglycosylase SLT domain-containing protein n=1 Tax=Actinacidiphila yanglinensis TaxID=310779 RepID=A0A1H5UYP6_9ACTN|nr:transglycosylase SLT domain-containing protein [Actinacidiphila yanglinensis]SEF80126.1 Transglycosylase SLT domain-containing protein [Actinacidiphila yanglinensis]